MTKARPYIRKMQGIVPLLIMALSFLLSPCKVQEALAIPFGTAAQLPTNKSKATTQANARACSAEVLSHARISASIKSNRENLLKSGSAPGYAGIAPVQSHAGKGFRKNTSGNSPPLYILFKRLKLAAA